MGPILLKPKEGRLQTAEHILLRVLKDRFDVVAGISRFKEDSGFLEVFTETDMRAIEKGKFENYVNEVIGQNLGVTKYVLSREDAAKLVDLVKVPLPVTQVTIIDIENFDKSPCRDIHVANTAEIGRFEIAKIEKVGKDRYRFTFRVE